jgi:fumarylacetoacetate (FAA) hydrolase family protein
MVGRVWREAHGPCVVLVRAGQVFDITALASTVSHLLERDDLLGFARTSSGELLGDAGGWLGKAMGGPNEAGAERILAPCDLQAIKACGVTFAVSLLERVIEEQAGGDAGRAEQIRADMQRVIGTNLSVVRPGSVEAERLKSELIGRGAWSQYMEVGIGPDAEVFSKAQPMSAVGFGENIGVHPASSWNNPEPEIVLAVNSRSQIVGATLGNDVNLRDIEGRSALLLGKAKDNNGSCAIGPFVRLFDENFTLDTIRSATVRLTIEGLEDGFRLDGTSRMSEISRDPADLVAQTCGRHHQYPDGFLLFLGTMFSPIQDRGAAGKGFTHRLGDRVTVSTPSLGSLINEVQRCDEIAPWTFGIRALYQSLASRGIASSSAGTLSGPPEATQSEANYVPSQARGAKQC